MTSSAVATPASVGRAKGVSGVPGEGRVAALIALSLFAGGCAPSDARFAVRYAPDFQASARTVSVLGVVQDGVMSRRAWQTFAADLSSALNSSSCESGLDASVRGADAGTYTAVEERVSSTGVDDALLSTIAPAARGDYILVVRTYGRPSSGHAHPRQTLIAHGGGAERMSSDIAPRLKASARPLPEISAALFSVASRRTVVEAAMEYSGGSWNEAEHAFAKNLGLALPNLACVGWNWSALSVKQEVDDAGILIRRSLVPVPAQ